ncbi:prolyl oligopeptidase family serine peptidase, partial [Rubrivirga sp.]|uniref:S9 family peptidase n=1 Tax=Rubrivirga sp. TaxID=1885344 RepID=UPI003C757EA0
QFVAFTLSDDLEAERTLMVDYVTDSGAAEEISARPKIGGVRTGADLFVQDLEADTTVQIDLGVLPDVYQRPSTSRPDSSRLLLPTLRWAPSGRVAVLDVRTVDNEDRWIARLDLITGALEVVDHQRDAAWIAGPGISWAGGVSRGGFLPDGRYVFQSERTGWSHLYAANLDNGTVEALTEGAFEVTDATLSADGSFWILQTSEGDLGQRHLWRMPNTPGGWDRRQKLTEGVGRWDGALSPDGRRLAMLYSAANRPPEVYVADLDDLEAEQVTSSTTEAWNAYPWRDAEIIEVPASDGVMVPARIYRPDEPNGAAVLFVHGAGYLQNAHRWWSSYFREYQFHNLLADAGYTVLDVDYRASAGYGRDWRTAIAGHMGGRDLQDYVDASRYLEDEFDIDPERVSIYGGSYGGFITLMALFTEPEHFGSGAALRSVTDWAHYNDGYTRNILGTPVEDPEAFERSSPIEFAAGLQDPLLMTHGLVDDNVQPQDIFRLSQKLIELGKRDWELALAPVEPHGYREPTSWADKLHRILDLIEHTVGPDRDDDTEG